MKNKKQYIYPRLMVSVSEEDLKIAKILREEYFINISAFVRKQLRSLYNDKINEDK